MNTKDVMKMALGVVALAGGLMVSQAQAGGVIGDGFEVICGNCGAGKRADDVNRTIKKKVPGYAEAEKQIVEQAKKIPAQVLKNGGRNAGGG